MHTGGGLLGSVEGNTPATGAKEGVGKGENDVARVLVLDAWLETGIDDMPDRILDDATEDEAAELPVAVIEPDDATLDTVLVTELPAELVE